MLLPVTQEEMKRYGWKQLDVVIITGDTYIDSPFIGAAVIGNVLNNAGYKVGIIAQPNINSNIDIQRLGEPKLFWGITAGSLDSMVANYTALKKRRKKDDFTPGEENTKRPDRASIVYTNLIRRYFKNTKPIVLGGIEASLRRIAHYDFWDDSIRKSILFDAKADILVYGMAEKSIVELANKIKNNENIIDTKGICYISNEPKQDFLELPSYEEVVSDKQKFIKMFDLFYNNNDPITARGLYQKQNSRYLIHNPPNYINVKELDEVYNLDYTRELHPFYKRQGKVKAQETIKFSIITHRGCYGECNFCSIAMHQGRTVVSRSEESILKEAEKISKMPDFKGYILDIGGPTANMYDIECLKKIKYGACKNRRCLYPKICKELRLNHESQIRLLRKTSRIKGVKKAFVASGIRYDMLLEDKKRGMDYLREIVESHTSGQLKIAPEHTENKVLKHMGKPDAGYLERFRSEFDRLNKESGKKQFLTYYLIAAHPGCELKDMKRLKEYTIKKLRINPEQIQIFTPLPSTYSALMYYTGIDPFTGEKIFVEKGISTKEKQKQAVL